MVVACWSPFIAQSIRNNRIARKWVAFVEWDLSRNMERIERNKHISRLRIMAHGMFGGEGVRTGGMLSLTSITSTWRIAVYSKPHPHQAPECQAVITCCVCVVCGGLSVGGRSECALMRTL